MSVDDPGSYSRVPGDASETLETQAGLLEGSSREPALPMETKSEPKPVTSSLDKDAYGLMILRLVEWWDPRDITPFPKLAVFSAAILWVLNILCQGGITLALLDQCEILERPYEPETFLNEMDMTAAAAVELLQQGMAILNTTEAETLVPESVLTKCADTVGARYIFYAMMVFLWFTKNWGEMEKSLVMFGRYKAIETRTDPDSLLLSDDTHILLQLEVWQKVVLIVVAPLSKLVVVAGVTYAGMKFLILQKSETTLLLKALCMQFVVTIDELLFTLTTSRTKENINSAKVQSKKEATNLWKKGGAWDTGLGGVIYLLLATSVVLFMLKVVFKDFVAFRRACTEYHLVHAIPGLEDEGEHFFLGWVHYW